jgi:ribosomal protein L11 methyltransferase
VIRLAVRVDREQAEIVLAELLELVPAGVEEVQVGGQVEYAVYGAPGELPSLPDLTAAAGDALVEISTSHTPDDWQERWKRFHRPVLVEAARDRAGAGRRVPALRVRPPWEGAPARADGGIEEIVIDPGQAFGTGGHASTHLCLELLLELAALQPPAGPLLDVGTGSGVLAIAAARLGFVPVLGLDYERESVQAARRNAAVNGVEIEVRRFDLRARPLPWLDGQAAPAGSPAVVANLLRPLLLELAPAMRSAPSHLIAGGLLQDEVDEIACAFGDRFGLRVREERERDGWAAVWLLAGRAADGP